MLIVDSGGPRVVWIGDNFLALTDIIAISSSGEPIGLLEGANDALNLFTVD